jgi:hypothetical protein
MPEEFTDYSGAVGVSHDFRKEILLYHNIACHEPNLPLPPMRLAQPLQRGEVTLVSPNRAADEYADEL